MRISSLLIVFSISCSLFTACDRVAQTSEPRPNSTIERAYQEHKTDVQVEGDGVILRILADDTQGSPHQRFIVRLPSGRTVLVQHNIELAPRLDDLKEGDPVSFFGEYIWNEQGGLIHWTHHDPAGRHVTGWIKHESRTFQ